MSSELLNGGGSHSSWGSNHLQGGGGSTTTTTTDLLSSRLSAMSTNHHKGLWGRQTQLDQLQALARRVQGSEATKQVALVHGPSGCGKTSLCHALKSSITTTTSTPAAATGNDTAAAATSNTPAYRFVFGKFDQYQDNSVPYSALAQAMEGAFFDMTRQESQALVRSLGPDCLGVLCTLVPASEAFLSDDWSSSRSSESSSSFSKAWNDKRQEPTPTTLNNSHDKTRQQQDGTSSSSSPKGASGKLVLSSTLLGLAMTKFLTQISSSQRPTILVLDDLQWADQDSLAILKVIVHLQQIKNLFLIGIYRDRMDHPESMSSNGSSSNTTNESYTRLHAWLNEATCDDQGTTLPHVHDIAVTALDPLHTSKFVRYLLCLEQPEEESYPRKDAASSGLMDLVYRKTMGNPFYVVQFLRLLQKESLLQFNYGTNTWQWELTQVQSATSVAQNVAALLTVSVQSLPWQALRVLQLAACLGYVFDVELLQELYQISHTNETGETICPFLGTTKRTAEDEKEEESEKPNEATDISQTVERLVQENYLEAQGNHNNNNKLYRFTHDQVQRTVYELIPPGTERDNFHWFIGTYIYNMFTTGSASRSKLLFLATDQLNRGCPASRIATMKDEERKWLMELNFQAANLAKDRHGLDLTGLFLDKAKTLIQAHVDWDTSYELVLHIYNSIVSLEISRGRYEEGIAIVDIILQHAGQAQDTIVALASRTTIRAAALESNVALEDAKNVLQLCGERLPTVHAWTVSRELRRTKRLVEGKSEEELSALFQKETEADKNKLIAMKTYLTASVCGWHGDTTMLALCFLGLFRLAIQFRRNQYTGIAFTAFGALLANNGDVELGHRLTQLGL